MAPNRLETTAHSNDAVALQHGFICEDQCMARCEVSTILRSVNPRGNNKVLKTERDA